MPLPPGETGHPPFDHHQSTEPHPSSDPLLNLAGQITGRRTNPRQIERLAKSLGYNPKSLLKIYGSYRAGEIDEIKVVNQLAKLARPQNQDQP